MRSHIQSRSVSSPTVCMYICLCAYVCTVCMYVLTRVSRVYMYECTMAFGICTFVQNNDHNSLGIICIM